MFCIVFGASILAEEIVLFRPETGAPKILWGGRFGQPEPEGYFGVRERCKEKGTGSELATCLSPFSARNCRLSQCQTFGIVRPMDFIYQ
jgi:hypothetical protein